MDTVYFWAGYRLTLGWIELTFGMDTADLWAGVEDDRKEEVKNTNITSPFDLQYLRQSVLF